MIADNVFVNKGCFEGFQRYRLGMSNSMPVDCYHGITLDNQGVGTSSRSVCPLCALFRVFRSHPVGPPVSQGAIDSISSLR